MDTNFDNTSEQSYDGYKAQLKEEQGTFSREEISNRMKQQSEFTIDLDNLPKQQHRWVDRGLKMSCEGAGHPNHQSWKIGQR